MDDEATETDEVEEEGEDEQEELDIGSYVDLTSMVKNIMEQSLNLMMKKKLSQLKRKKLVTKS